MEVNRLFLINKIPFYSIDLDTDLYSFKISHENLTEWLKDDFTPKDIICSHFRGVSFENFEKIKNFGIDVEPTDSVIYCDNIEKASEYGDWPKLIMAFKAKCVKKTFDVLSFDADEKEIEKAKKNYPTIVTSKDSEWIWLSRLKPDDPNLASSYERHYARWIEGDPFDALRFVLIVGQNSEQLKAAINEIELKNLDA